jgi:threonine aldolase
MRYFKKDDAMKRRHFLSIAGAAATAGWAASAPGLSRSRPELAPSDGRPLVDFSVDGLGLTPREYAADLAALAEGSSIEVDYYSLGGTVAELELRFAALLGKERAIFVPTGTLANHMAVRKLAGFDRRVLVQADSHLFNDCGDCASLLSGLTLVPLAAGRSTFTVEDVAPWVSRTAGGRVESRIGVIMIESPVRRLSHQVFDFAAMRAVSAFARDRGIRLHLDGARLFNVPYHTGRSVQEMTGLFDTVYVSLWKCFNAASGAILAGSAKTIDGLFHMRRMFGGSLPQAWPILAVALKYIAGYPEAYAQAWARASRFLALLQAEARFAVERVPNGTSAFKLILRQGDASAFVVRLQARGVILPHPEGDPPVFRMIVNPSLNRVDPAELAHDFVQAI